jgi:hypothetical protein
MTVVRIVTGGLLMAHGLVHLLYLAPDVPEFTFDRSWVVPQPARGSLGLGLLVATVAAYALLALAVWGMPGLAAAWPALAIAAALLSAALLLAFWNTWLLLGLTIDLLVLVVAVTQPSWVERLVG